MMYTLVDTKLDQIDPNPHRDLATYPWVEPKVSELMRSIDAVGFWAGVIARPKGNRVELAFGHHRIEAARRLKLDKVPLIIRKLDDADMLRFMARENGEDYHAEFLMMLNTWEGALRFLSRPSMDGQKAEPIDIAKFLGWTVRHKSGDRGFQMSSLAAACDAAHVVFENGIMTRADLRDLPYSEVREIVTRARANIRILEDSGKTHNRPRQQTEAAKQIVGQAAVIVADKARKGEVARRDLRTEVDVTQAELARTKKPKLLPLFREFGNRLCEQIARMLNSDGADRHINEIATALSQLTLEEDHAVVRRLHHELDELAIRVSLAKKRTTPNKVVTLKSITGE